MSSCVGLQPTLPGALPVPAEAPGLDMNDSAASTLSVSNSHLYAQPRPDQHMLASPITPDAASFGSAGAEGGMGGAADAADDSLNHNDSSRMTVAPQNCPTPRHGPRGGATSTMVAHNPYSCSPSFLDLPVDLSEMSSLAVANETSGMQRAQVVLSIPDYSLQQGNGDTVRVHLKQRVVRHSAGSTLMHAASPLNLSLDPSQLRSLDATPVNTSFSQLSMQDAYHQRPAQPSLAALRAASRGSVRQHSPYAESLIPPGHELGHKTFMSEDGEGYAYASEAGTEENFLTPRETVYDLPTDTSCLPSPSTVPLTPESVSMMAAAGGTMAYHDLRALGRGSPATPSSRATALSPALSVGQHAAAAMATATSPLDVPSSAVSEAPTSMSIASGKRRRRHGRKPRGHGKGGASTWDDLMPEMDLMFLPPPPPPLQHLSAMQLPLYGMPCATDATATSPSSACASPSTAAAAAAGPHDAPVNAAYARYRAMVTRWYERAVLSEHSYLVAAYGGTGEVARPCPRKEQFVRDSVTQGAVAVSALVAWVASMEQWWMECVQPFSFTRRHQALPPSMTAAALAASSTHHSAAGSSRTHTTGTASSTTMRRANFAENARLTPLVLSSGTSSAAPGSPLQWVSPQSPAAMSMFAYSGSHTMPPTFASPASASACARPGTAGSEAYPVCSAPSYFYSSLTGHNEAMAAPQAWSYYTPAAQYPPQPQHQQHQQHQQPRHAVMHQGLPPPPAHQAVPRTQSMYQGRQAPRFHGAQWQQPVSPYANQILH